MARVRFATPPLAAAYATARERPKNPDVEPTLTILPPAPCATIWRAACWLIRKGPVSVTAITASHCSLVMSRMFLLSEMAALLTRMSMRPHRETTAATTRAIWASAAISATNAAALRDLGRNPVAACLVGVDYRHLGARGGQRFRNLLADIAAGAGDDGDLI